MSEEIHRIFDVEWEIPKTGYIITRRRYVCGAGHCKYLKMAGRVLGWE